MKITLLDNADEITVVPGMTLDIAIRVTEDDDTVAPNAHLQWATFRPDHRFKDGATVTDKEGIAQNAVTATPHPLAKPEPVFVQTPDGEIHLIGTFRCRSPHVATFHPAPPDHSATPVPRIGKRVRQSTAPSSGPYGLTLYYPEPESIMPADCEVRVYARLVDGAGNGIRGASITVEPSTSQIEYTPLPITTDWKGWAIFWVRAVGLEEKAPDQLRGTITVTASQYNCTDTKPLHFDTTVGGPGYFSISHEKPFQMRKPQLVEATYRNRDGSPAKYREVTWLSGGSEGTSSIICYRSSLVTDDSGVSRSYATPNASECYFLLITPNRNKRFYGSRDDDGWTSDLLDLQPDDGKPFGEPLQVVKPYYDAPPLKGHAPHDISMGASSAVTWVVEPEDAPVKLRSSQTSPVHGTANNQVTGIGSAPMYSAGIKGTYTNDDTTHIAINTYAFYSGDALPSLAGEIQLTSLDGDTLSMVDWHTIEALYTKPDGTPWANKPIAWSTDRSDRITFEHPYPSTTGSDGKCNIRVAANGPEDLINVTITAVAPNPLTGMTDKTPLPLVFDSSAQSPSDDGTIKITSTDKPPLTPYAGHRLTATYEHFNKSPFVGKNIVWSAFPSGQFDFSPNPSQTDDSGKATTAITAVGDSYQGPVTVYARAYNEATEYMDIGSLASLTFSHGTPPAKKAHIALMPLDGDLISDPLSHLVQATYKRLDDNTPLAHQEIHWEVSPAGSISFPNGSTKISTKTDGDGVAGIAFTCNLSDDFVVATVTASATNPETGDTVSKLPICIKDGGLVDPEALGYLAVNPKDHPPYFDGESYDLEATYLQPDNSHADNKYIYWAAYPEDQISFTRPNPSETNSFGKSNNGIICSSDRELDGVIVSASSPNYATGSYDFGQTVMSFKKGQAHNPPSLKGIMIDRPFTQNPPLSAHKVDPDKKHQVISGQVILTGPNIGEQPVKLMPQPSMLGLSVFQGGQAVSKNQEDGSYTLTTTADGTATFQLGAVNLQLASLTASCNGLTTDKEHPTELVVALIDDDLATVNLPSPIYTGQMDPVPNNVPTFTISIPDTSTNIAASDQIAIIINDRIVYYGEAKYCFDGVPVAYAVLNTSGANILSYLRQSVSEGGQTGTTWERKQLRFAASGTAQTVPDRNLSQRPLHAPEFVGSEPIGPKDIVAGLNVTIPPYNDVMDATQGDEITIYFYLSGQDPLTLKPISNIATVSQKLGDKDNLLQGKPQIFALDQVYASGYGQPGQLQIDYKVKSAISTIDDQWSRITGPLDLNTTL